MKKVNYNVEKPPFFIFFFLTVLICCATQKISMLYRVGFKTADIDVTNLLSINGLIFWMIVAIGADSLGKIFSKKQKIRERFTLSIVLILFSGLLGMLPFFYKKSDENKILVLRDGSEIPVEYVVLDGRFAYGKQNKGVITVNADQISTIKSTGESF